MKEKDDWNWDTYTRDNYLPQLNEVLETKLFDFFITKNGINISEAGLTFNNKIHVNSMELYNIAYLLQPKSILEVGCGMCVQLINLATVLPNAEIFGIDISQNQVDVGMAFTTIPDKILNNIKIMDITKETPTRMFDFVYSQAVIMHMSTNNAIKALSNMRDVSNKYVFLIENENCHEGWEDMIYNVFGGWGLCRPHKFIPEGILLTKND